jgi:hypothetical protein
LGNDCSQQRSNPERVAPEARLALSKDGRAAFLSSFNERLDKGVRYPVQGRPGKTRNIKQRDVIRFE